MRATGSPSAAIGSPRLYGMRRTYLKPSEETRLDGRKYPLEPYLFYTMGNDGRLYTGNSKHLVDDPASGDPSDEADSSRLLALFRTFEGQLAGRRIEETTDPETLRALQALGYVR